jgi:3-dehydroquinate synthetase
MNIDDVLKAFRYDKKNTSAGLQFVVPHDIGDVRQQIVQDDKLLRDVLNSIVTPSPGPT